MGVSCINGKDACSLAACRCKDAWRRKAREAGTWRRKNLAKPTDLDLTRSMRMPSIMSRKGWMCTGYWDTTSDSAASRMS
jgi:hypothetical protein